LLRTFFLLFALSQRLSVASQLLSPPVLKPGYSLAEKRTLQSPSVFTAATYQEGVRTEEMSVRTRRFVTFLQFILALVVLLGTAVQGSAQKKSPEKPQPPKLSVTDAAGRVHVRPMRQRITVAQRRAAAQHRKALHAKTGQNTTTTVNKGEVKK
jgi:hypothetical protein